MNKEYKILRMVGRILILLLYIILFAMIVTWLFDSPWSTLLSCVNGVIVGNILWYLIEESNNDK